MHEHPGVELSLLEATVDAQRALLRARRPEDVVKALERTVAVLGGEVVPGHVGGDEVLHLDIALGVRDPVLPWAAPDDPARARLQRVLPGLIEDGRRLVHLLWAAEEVGDPALRDELTGALHASATARLVDRSPPDTTLVVLGLTGVTAIEQVHGRSRVDLLLRQLARFVRSELDVDERLGRSSGPTLVVVAPHAADDRPSELAERVAARWERQRTVAVAIRSTATRRGDDPEAALSALSDALRDDRVDGDQGGGAWNDR